MPVNVFGGGPVQTADVSYESFDLNSANSPYQLNWPSSYRNSNKLVTGIMDVNAVATNLITPANLVSTINLITTYANGAAGIGATLTLTDPGPLTIDGLEAVLDNRILVIGQANAAQNGIYRVTTEGSVSVHAILTRSDDYDTPSEISQGDDVNITEGIAFADSSWSQTAPGPFVIGTTAITWVQSNPNVILPKANEVSVGMNFIIRNIGDTNFNLLDNAGVSIGIIKADFQYYYYLTNNSTEAGIWKYVVFGAGTSSADAGVLAGNGLINLIGKLNTNIAVTPITTSPYTIKTSDRANLLVWATGSGIVNLPATGVLPSGFYFSFNNEGTGTATITPPTVISPIPPIKIDSSIVGLVVTPGQSLSCIYDGTNWFSLGLGPQTLSLISVLSLDVSLSPTTTLTLAQASKNIHIYTGLLTANVTVIFPLNLINQWTIFNKTTGAFTLTIKYANTIGPVVVGNSYIIPRLGEQVFFNDGTNLYQSTNYVSLINGTTALPSLNFLGGSTSSSGFRSDTTGNIFLANNNPATSLSVDLINFGTNGAGFGIHFLQPNAKLDLSSATNTTGNQILLNNGTTALPSLNFLGGSTSSSGFRSDTAGTIFLANNNPVTLTSLNIIQFAINNGIKFLQPSATLDLTASAGSQVLLVNGTAALPSLQFLSGDGLYSSGADHISVTCSGTQIADFSNTFIKISAPIAPAGSIKATSFHNQSPTTTTGDMIYYNGTTDVRLPIGTAGKPLVSSGGIPAFAGLSIRQIVPISTATISSITNTTPTDISGLAAAITPSATNSQIFVMVDISCALNSPNASTSILNFQLFRGATAINPLSGGVTATFQGSTVVTGGTVTLNTGGKVCFNFLDNPGTTALTTYKVQFYLSVAGSTGYINRPASVATPTSTSTITVIEVAGF